MADNIGYSYQSPIITSGPPVVGLETQGGYTSGYKPNYGAGQVSSIMYFQRQYDLTLNQYVYYKLSFITATPGTSQTTPNHTNNFKSDSHEVLLRTTEVI